MTERTDSVWNHYTRCFDIELSRRYTVGQRKAGPANLVLIRWTKKVDLDWKLRLLRQLRGCGSFVTYSEVFSSSSSTDVDMVYEYNDLTLLHIMQV